MLYAEYTGGFAYETSPMNLQPIDKNQRTTTLYLAKLTNQKITKYLHMLIKMPLKNSEAHEILLDAQSRDLLIELGIVQKEDDRVFRLHSAGYAVYQKWEDDTCSTIYLHKLIATHFVPKPDLGKRLFVRVKNGNKLDCRVENLEWVTMGLLRRQMRKTDTQTGYRGVTFDKGKYRSIINVDGTRINLGTFNTAREAAIAYNNKSRELFGETRSLNDIPEDSP